MEFWGFKAVMGRLWTILYLSPEPLSAAELGERLQASAGAVSMALADLQKWGVVKKAWRPGERRDFYEPETSIWKMVTRVFRERELGYVRAAIESFETARKPARQAARRAPTPRLKRRIKFIDGRISSLLTLSRIGEGLLMMLLERPARRSAADEDAVPPGGRVMKLSLAYSTDLDDAFMFWPLATGRLDPRDFGFDGAEHVRSDTATLNALGARRRARRRRRLASPPCRRWRTSGCSCRTAARSAATTAR